jgi:alpha-glucosidase
MLLLTLRGTPTLYYGDEIGMRQAAIPPERVRDPFERNVPGRALGRDGCRTPMPWDEGPFAGFSQVEPWLPLSSDADSVNVARQRADTGSLLNFYRRLIALRRARPALTRGAYRPVAADGEVLAYIREEAGDRLLAALNFGPEPAQLPLPADSALGTVLVGSANDRAGEEARGRLTLGPHEGVLLDLG